MKQILTGTAMRRAAGRPGQVAGKLRRFCGPLSLSLSSLRHFQAGVCTIRIALLIHLLSVIVWVGGMFFAYQCLRPAAAQALQPAQRLTLWKGTLARFFIWVWAAVVLLLVSGFYMVIKMGGFAAAGRHVHVMLVVGIIMMLIFAHVFFVPYRRLVRFVQQTEYPQAGKQLAQIRILVGTNLVLGLLLVAEVVLLR